MAIVIPSKNIYDISNSKVVNNKIQAVNVPLKIIRDKVDNRKNFFTVSVDLSQVQFRYPKEQQKEYHFYDNDSTHAERSFTYAYVQAMDTILFPVKIPRRIGNSYISKIYSGISKNEDGGASHNIQFSYFGTKTVYDLVGTITANVDNGLNTVSNVVLQSIDRVSNTPKKEETISDWENQLKLEAIAEGLPTSEDNSSVFDERDTTIASATFKLINEGGEDFFTTNLKFTVGGVVKTLSYSNPNGLGSNLEYAYGEEIVYTPTKLEFSFLGDVLDIEIEEQTNQSNGENEYSLEESELLQNGTYIHGQPAEQFISNAIINQYQNGKETVELLCSVSNYFDENGDQKIFDNGAGKMFFENGDIVLPMNYSAQGVDVPLSLIKGRTPKIFSVVGSKMIYDGSVLQRLYLQEYIEHSNVELPQVAFTENAIYQYAGAEYYTQIFVDDTEVKKSTQTLKYYGNKLKISVDGQISTINKKLVVELSNGEKIETVGSVEFDITENISVVGVYVERGWYYVTTPSNYDYDAAQTGYSIYAQLGIMGEQKLVGNNALFKATKLFVYPTNKRRTIYYDVVSTGQTKSYTLQDGNDSAFNITTDIRINSVVLA